MIKIGHDAFHDFNPISLTQQQKDQNHNCCMYDSVVAAMKMADINWFILYSGRKK